MGQFFMFAYMKKSTKIIIASIIVLLVILSSYKIYDRGKKQGIAMALENEEQEVAYYIGSNMRSYLMSLTAYIQNWNLGENSEYEEGIIMFLENIKTIIKSPYINQNYFRKYNLINQDSNDYTLYAFYNNLQCFFCNEENINVLSFSNDNDRKINKVNYYMEDGILSEEEKNYISECLKLIKLSYERLENSRSYADNNSMYDFSYDKVKDALFLEYGDKNTKYGKKDSMMVDFINELLK